MFNRVLNTAMNYHSSPVFMSFYLFTVKPYLATKNVSSSKMFLFPIYMLGVEFCEVFFNSCAEMQSSSANAALLIRLQDLCLFE